MIRPVTGDPLFSTAGIGLIPGTDGDVDQVVRKEAWEKAHGGEIRLNDHAWTPLLDGWPFPFAEGTGPSFLRLEGALARLDEAERQGRCPVHGNPP